jgi:hypothetical protein
MVTFAEEIEETLYLLREATQTIERMIDSLRRGETPDFNTLSDFFSIYDGLVSRTIELHRTWVIGPFLFFGKPTLEPIEEIVTKLLELTKEYEKVTIRYPRIDDIERILLLRRLILAINKYTTEIETILKKHEKQLGKRETPT